MDPTFGMALATAIVGIAAWTLTLWWLTDTRPLPTAANAAMARDPMDDEPHTLTLLGPDGRPNPLHYERLPTYAAALSRQRELTRRGHASVITHADSGRVRLDLSAWFGPYGRIGL
ncbi:MAG: hypothetical protein ACM3Q1_08140 [Bacteroidales bacterium]